MTSENYRQLLNNEFEAKETTKEDFDNTLMHFAMLYHKEQCAINGVSNSYAIVRWHDNKYEDVVCINKQTALEYIEKYNKLAGEEMCFLDEDVWLPLDKA